MAGLVAAHTVTALEIKETGLAQTQGASTAMLAQIGEIPEAERAVGNSNADTVHSRNVPVDPKPILGDIDIAAKIDIETEASLGGLDAKREFILKKLRWQRDQGVQEITSLADQCREKFAVLKEEGKDRLDSAAATAIAAAKQCRVDFVEATLARKEAGKGQLEDLLNTAIQAIKELKVQEIFTESGIPGGDSTSAIQTEIEGIISTFDTDTEDVYSDFYNAL